MAMPQCCYLAKGAMRPSHTTNTIKFNRIPFDPCSNIEAWSYGTSLRLASLLHSGHGRSQNVESLNAESQCRKIFRLFGSLLKGSENFLRRKSKKYKMCLGCPHFLPLVARGTSYVPISLIDVDFFQFGSFYENFFSDLGLSLE